MDIVDELYEIAAWLRHNSALLRESRASKVRYLSKLNLQSKRPKPGIGNERRPASKIPVERDKKALELQIRRDLESRAERAIYRARKHPVGSVAKSNAVNRYVGTKSYNVARVGKHDWEVPAHIRRRGPIGEYPKPGGPIGSPVINPRRPSPRPMRAYAGV